WSKLCVLDKRLPVSVLCPLSSAQELGKTWEEVQSEDDRELVDDEDDDWSDWQAHPVSAVCLFCDHRSETMEQIYTHMKDAHGFDLHHLRTELSE
ncbi:zinc finger protein 277-like, partial [Plectropomus leopardus]|uniref:zinc finger protein 277-like n=1 Tax=Plectropomus leopardus TaxID=160734 RepID=UPI001C4B8F56